MKLSLYIAFTLLCFTLTITPAFAQEQPDEEYVIKEGVVIPEEINWTERYILDEIKSLRLETEKLKRFTIREVNDRKIETIDKALSYSTNTVNYFFIIFTIAIAGFGLFGWRSILEIKNSLKNTFENQLATILEDFQERLATIEQAQMDKHKAIVQKQEEFQKQQEIGAVWSAYNREEDYRKKLEYLEKLDHIGEKKKSVMIEKTNVYLYLGFYEKTLDMCQMLLRQHPDNATLLYNRAAAYAGLDRKEEATNDINQLVSLSPHFIESILEDKLFDGLAIRDKLEEQQESKEK